MPNSESALPVLKKLPFFVGKIGSDQFSPFAMKKAQKLFHPQTLAHPLTPSK